MSKDANTLQKCLILLLISHFFSCQNSLLALMRYVCLQFSQTFDKMKDGITYYVSNERRKVQFDVNSEKLGKLFVFGSKF